MGADVVIDPKEKSPYESWKEIAADPSALQDSPACWACVSAGSDLRMRRSAGRHRSDHDECAAIGARVVRRRCAWKKIRSSRFSELTRKLNIQFVLGYDPRILRHVAKYRRGQNSGRAADHRQGRVEASRRRSRISDRRASREDTGRAVA